MKLHFDVAAFHREIAKAQRSDEVDEVVSTFVEHQRQGEAANSAAEGFNFTLARDFILSLRPVRGETFRTRIATCLACNRCNIIVGEAGDAAGLKIVQCLECSCVMNAKARFRGSMCPLGKFDIEID